MDHGGGQGVKEKKKRVSRQFGKVVESKRNEREGFQNIPFWVEMSFSLLFSETHGTD